MVGEKISDYIDREDLVFITTGIQHVLSVISKVKLRYVCKHQEYMGAG